MRVLFLSPASGLGGAERCLLDLIASLRATYPDLAAHVIAAADGPMLEMAGGFGATAELLPMPESLVQFGDTGLREPGRLGALLEIGRSGVAAGLGVRGYLKKLDERVSKFRPSVVHSNGLKFHLLSVLSGSSGVPVLWHIRDLLSARPLVTNALRRLWRRPAGAIAISRMVRDDTRGILPGLQVDILYDAIDTEYFSPGPGDGEWLDKLAGVPPAASGTIRVGLIATYGRWKGQGLFMEAISKIPSFTTGPPVRYYVVGGPIYQTRGSQFSEAELRSRATELGVADRVAFVGFQDDVVKVFRSLDVIVHASTRPEPFGRTIAEAMACAKPVILARTSGAAELFESEEDMIRFAPGNSEALGQGIRAVAEDEVVRARMASRAREIAVSRFSRDRLGREVMTIYKRVGASGPSDKMSMEST